MKFSPDGAAFASGAADRMVYLWGVQGDCETYAVLKGHKKAVLELHWAEGGQTLVTCSPDRSVRAWDADAGVQIKRMEEHRSFVNSCCPAPRGPPLLVSGSDDCTVKLWDLRVKRSVQTFQEPYQVTAVAFAVGGAADRVLSGGIEGKVRSWDLRKSEVAFELEGHSDIVTGLAVSSDGDFLASNSMDNTLRTWDLRPYAPEGRGLKVLRGHSHGFEKNLLRCAWSPDCRHLTCGSADRHVNVWRHDTGELVYRLPGHLGSVNEAVFHPSEPIVGSCSSDRRVYLGELDLE